MRYLFLFCLLFPLSLLAQKEDYVWCFGDSLGLDFNEKTQPKIIRSCASTSEFDKDDADALESCASITTAEGELLFYLKAGIVINNSTKSLSYLIDGCGKKIINSDSITVDYSSTNGAIILPINEKYYLLTRSEKQTNTLPGLFLTKLEYSVSEKKIVLVYKNKKILNDLFSEKIAAVKHTNGNDWWVLIHKESFINDTFYIYLLDKEGIRLHHKQKIGSTYFNNRPLC